MISMAAFRIQMNQKQGEDKGWMRVHIMLTVKDVLMTPELLTDVAEATEPS